MESTAPDLSVRDVLRAPTTNEFAGVEAFAHRVTHRFRPLADAGRTYGDRLSASIEARWAPPRQRGGIEVLDAQGFEDMIRDWQVRRGYDDLAGEASGPFVIPVDPDDQVGGFSATDAHSGRGRERLRAVAPPARPTPRRNARPQERWRAAGAGTFSPYPAALGNAGRIAGSLLRFPEARAVVGTNEARALVVEEGPATPWGNVLSFAPAARGAERIAAETVARTQPAATTPVGIWLEQAHVAATPGRILPGSTRGAGRWQSAGFASVVHAPVTPGFALGRLAQQFLDAPDATLETARARVGSPGYLGDAFDSGRDFVETPTQSRNAAETAAGPDQGFVGTKSPALVPVVAPKTSRSGTPTSIALRIPPPSVRTAVPGLGNATVSPPGRLASSAILTLVPQVLTPAVSKRAPSSTGERPAAVLFDRMPALLSPLTGGSSDGSFPTLTRGAFIPAATRAAAEAESSPLTLRLRAEADETPELAQNRYDIAPRAPELWTGFEVSDTTLVHSAAPARLISTSDEPGAGVTRAQRRSDSTGGAPHVSVPSARAHLLRTRAAERPGGRPASARTIAQTKGLTSSAPPTPLSRAAFAAVLLPTLLHGKMAPVARSMLVSVPAERISPAAQAAGRTVRAMHAGRASSLPATTTQAPAPRSVSAVDVTGGTANAPAPASKAPRTRGELATPLRATLQGATEQSDRRAISSPEGRRDTNTRPEGGGGESPARPFTLRPTDARVTLGTGMSLASSRFESIPQGPIAAAIADAIAARFPGEEEGPWGPRVVLPGRPLTLANDAPQVEFVTPTSVAVVVAEDSGQATAATPKGPRARTPAGAGSVATAHVAAMAGPKASAAATRRPTLLSPGRPGLPGALSPVLAERTNPTVVAHRAGSARPQASGRLAEAADLRPLTARATKSSALDGRSATATTRDAADQRPGTRTTLSRPDSLRTRGDLHSPSGPDTQTIAGRPETALGAFSITQPAPTTAPAGSASGLLGGRPFAAWRATADAFGPAAAVAELTLRFGLRIEDAVAALVPILGRFRATAAAQAMAPIDATQAAAHEQARVRVDGTFAADSFNPETPGLGFAWATRQPTASRLSDEAGPGDLLRPGIQSEQGDSFSFDRGARPTFARHGRATASAAIGLDASERTASTGSPTRAKSNTVTDAHFREMPAEFATAFSDAHPMAVLSVAGHTLLIPAAMAAALRQSSAEPAVLRALARSGSPALASLLAADAPLGILLGTSSVGQSGMEGPSTPAPSSASASASVALGVEVARRAATSARGERELSRALAAAGFNEPRGLRTPGRARRPAAANRPGSIESRPIRNAAWPLPTLASLVLPIGTTASPAAADRPSLDAFSLGNVDRALIAFDQVARRNPGTAGETWAPGHDQSTATGGTASTLLRSVANRSASGASAPGELVTPSVSEPGETATALSAGAIAERALVNPTGPPQKQPAIGSRLPRISMTSPAAPASRVMVDTGARRAGSAGPLKSSDGERPAREAETGEEARHRLAEGQIEESLSPEELDKIAHEVISQLKRQIELDAIRVGEDEWD